MPHYFVVSVGPVQDFIATARRSRDLWFGSWMLSELSKAAALALTKHSQFEQLIFPAPIQYDQLEPGEKTQSTFSVANKIVAIVKGNPGEVGLDIHQALNRRLCEMRTEALTHVRQKHQSFSEDFVHGQFKELIEYYWSAVQYASGSGYGDARTQAESILDASKTTRTFIQVIGQNVPKSSLDGIRESVIPAEAYPTQGDLAEQIEAKTARLYRSYGARRGEQLSGVDLVKRLGQRGTKIEEKFESTSQIAAKPYIEMLGAAEAEQLQNEIVTLLSSYGRENINIEDQKGALLYESRINEWLNTDDISSSEDLATKLDNIFENYSGNKRPDPYYALLLADGDRMGAAIDAQSTPEGHQKLSQKLSGFAENVSSIVKKYQGNLIYAGGDDVLAYLPLHQVLACLNELAETFVEAMKEFPSIDTVTNEEVRPTLSGGVVIAHHLDPLSDILDLARDAEKQAKSISGKDALAITLNKRSGAQRTVAAKREALVKRMQVMVRMHRAKEISKGAPYEIQALANTFVIESSKEQIDNSDSNEPDNQPSLRKALAKEAIRIIERKRQSESSKPLGQSTKDHFQQWIQTEKVSIHQIAQELIIANIFAAAEEMANGQSTENIEEKVAA